MTDRKRIRCDLAIDMAEFEGLSGRVDSENVSGRYGVKRESFVVRSKAEEEKTGMKCGKYVTLTRKNVYPESDDEKIYFERCLAKAISDAISFTELKDDFSVLVLGLGNGYMTADALGKRVTEGILTTRKLLKSKKMREVSAYSVGVAGVTGIDSFEVAKGLVNEIRPDLVIPVDSLCAFRTDRIGRCYQVTSCGIRAGSGAGKPNENRLDKESLGVPVIAVGVPFVVSARRLVYDVSGGKSGFDPVSPEEDMFVTYRDVDAILNECTSVIASAINIALHRSCSADDFLN